MIVDTFISNLNLCFDKRQLLLGDASIPLRNKEFSLMEFFLKNHGKVITRTEILEEVWDRNIFCTTNTVDVHISTLRRKLKKYSADKYIRTVHCVGYMFCV